MSSNRTIRVEVLIIVSLVEVFSSGGGVAIIPAIMMPTTHPSSIV
jgi:hypothetical protein